MALDKSISFQSQTNRTNADTRLARGKTAPEGHVNFVMEVTFPAANSAASVTSSLCIQSEFKKPIFLMYSGLMRLDYHSVYQTN